MEGGGEENVQRIQFRSSQTQCNSYSTCRSNVLLGPHIPSVTASIHLSLTYIFTRVGTLIVATIYLQLIQNRYMFRSFTVLHCSHQHCVQPVASDVEVVGYL